jgi:hypothetical protein
MDSAYLAAATALLWLALYYLPVGSPLFRLALPLRLFLPQLLAGGGLILLDHLVRHLVHDRKLRECYARDEDRQRRPHQHQLLIHRCPPARNG